MIWYLGVPAVLLGAFGLAVLAKRCTKSAPDLGQTRQRPPAIWALPLMMAICGRS